MNSIKNFLNKTIYAGAAILALTLPTACTDDLNQTPHIGVTSETVYATPEGYRSVLAKIYGSYTLVGQEKGGGADISSYSGHDLLRCLFNLQEGPTDECAFRWMSGDNLYSLAYIQWDATAPMISDVYYRLYYNIAVVNEFLRHTDEGSISGFDEATQATLRQYEAEARFMRALNYWFVLDLYGKGPYVDVNTPTTAYTPPAYDSVQLFEYIESEIKEIETLLPDTNDYGRADKATVWALASRMYLNAEVYTGKSYATQCIEYSKKILSTGRFTLEPDFKKLFNADNHKRTNEIIYGIYADGENAMTWGSGTNLVHGSCGSDNSQDPLKYGISSGWGNYRVRGEYADLFGDFNNTEDGRCLLWTDGQNQYFDTALDDGACGFHSEKWTNLTDEGEMSGNPATDGANTDFPMFRLAEIYLNCAEAVVRGGTGMTRSEALDLVNAIRRRAYGSDNGNINDSQLTLDFLLDERGREMLYENVRRTDLVRHGKFTTSAYIWQWKGGVAAGRAVEDRFNRYPIPASEISANPNLSNPDYTK